MKILTWPEDRSLLLPQSNEMLAPDRMLTDTAHRSFEDKGEAAGWPVSPDRWRVVTARWR